ncbi:MAG: hypothetical protein KKB50_07605 [Planctomycetes bacterium]|nr:hypothetical protein [Planctomycetota bacterium]
MSQTLTRPLVHFIFSTRNREDLIEPEIEAELYVYIGGVCLTSESPLLSMGAMATFEEEFVGFLGKYGVPYDRRYIWT